LPSRALSSRGRGAATRLKLDPTSKAVSPKSEG
jgi:hypothetical protein